MNKFVTCDRCDIVITRRDRRCSFCLRRAGAVARRYRAGKTPLRQERRASRWIAIDRMELRLRSGKTEMQIARKVYQLHEQLLQRFTWKQICKNGLDNPYMTELARRVIINQTLHRRYIGKPLNRNWKKSCGSVRNVRHVKHSGQFAGMRKSGNQVASRRAA